MAVGMIAIAPTFRGGRCRASAHRFDPDAKTIDRNGPSGIAPVRHPPCASFARSFSPPALRSSSRPVGTSARKRRRDRPRATSAPRRARAARAGARGLARFAPRRAMEEASEKTVLGNFAGARFTHAGVTSRFFRRDGRFFVNTDGPGGVLADFEIRYHVRRVPAAAVPDRAARRRLQALGIAWDARPRAQGGQPLVPPLPGAQAQGRDSLHWTGIDQNWITSAPTATRPTCARTTTSPPGPTRRPGRRSTSAARPATARARTTPSGEARPECTQGRRVEGADGRAGRAAGRHVRRSTPRPATRPARRRGPRAARSRRVRDATRGAASSTTPGIPVRHSATPIASRRSKPGLYYATARCATEVYNHGSFLQSRMHSKA